jgi:hypothetical protein
MEENLKEGDVSGEEEGLEEPRLPAAEVSAQKQSGLGQPIGFCGS